MESENKYHQPISFLEKIDELLELFKDFNPSLYNKTDPGYEWLEEDDEKCIVFVNPFNGENIEIDIGDMSEATLYFSGQHSHYDEYQGDYEDLVDRINSILHNESGAAIIKDADENWHGSCFIEKDELTKKPTEIFEFVFKQKEFADHLNESGYHVIIDFWNPEYSKEIIVPPIKKKD